MATDVTLAMRAVEIDSPSCKMVASQRKLHIEFKTAGKPRNVCMYRIDAFVFLKFRRLGTGNAKLQKHKQKYIIICLKGSHSRPER